MREILFRGKAANRNPNREYRTKYKNGDWVYGLLTDVENYAGFSEMTNTAGVSGIEVDKNTVGQFTGLVDKNDTKIFEGDVFQLEDDMFGVVAFQDGCFKLEEYGFSGTWTESGYDESGGEWGIIECEPLDFWYVNKLEIADNIHDNAELLEVINNGLR